MVVAEGTVLRSIAASAPPEFLGGLKVSVVGELVQQTTCSIEMTLYKTTTLLRGLRAWQRGILHLARPYSVPRP